MDGLLVVDKPAGPSSHDAVVRMRRVLGERRIGHTGTLDPAAAGVLPLVIGRATRLARFLTASDKCYEAVIRLGMRTTTGDREGDRIGPAHTDPLPSTADIDAALEGFRGTFLQRPPAFSAKKIGGRRSYHLARAGGLQGTVLPDPVSVTVHALRLAARDRDRLTLHIHCSAGFYVRSLADDLGTRLGTGGFLEALRRTRNGEFTLIDAIALEDAERNPTEAVRRVIPLARVLTPSSSVVLNGEGVRHAQHGRDLGPTDWISPPPESIEAAPAAGREGAGRCAIRLIRLLDDKGDLVGVAEPAKTPGLLHPSVVLV